MLMPVLAVAYAALAAAHPSPLSVECQVVGKGPIALAPPARLYTGRHDARFPIVGETLLDMRYDALANTVTVTVMEVPHAPWSFGEKVIERERVFEPSKGGFAVEALGPPDRLVCTPG